MRKNRIMLLASAATLILLIICGCHPVAPSSLSAAGDRFSAVRQLIQETIKRLNLPSLVVAVAKDGQTVWEEAWGYADIEKQVPATPQTMYSLASVSKPITATGLMVLVQKGLVELDKPANDYLGSGRLTAFAGDAQKATVRRLLLHTAGLPMHWNFRFPSQGDSRPDMDETIGRYGILVNPPGEQFTYSNLGYGILDQIISRVSGKSFDEFMSSDVFAPLGMTRSSIFTAPGPEPKVAQRYTVDRQRLPFFDFDHRGASAIYASARDLLRFGLFHLGNKTNAGQLLLNKENRQAMHQPQVPVPAEIPEIKTSYGLGWTIIDIPGYRMLNHTGGMPGATTRLTLIPKENVVCVILCNSGLFNRYDFWDIEWSIFRALVDRFPAQPTVPEPVAQGPETSFTPPPALIGQWQGAVHVADRNHPAKLVFEKEAGVLLEIDGLVCPAITAPNPLGGLGFKEGVFQGLFLGRIDTPDTARARHVVLLRLRPSDRKLSGTASAVAVNQTFCLPFWMELAKKAD